MDELNLDDKRVRQEFDQLRREVFEIEKLKYRRLQEAAERKLTGHSTTAAKSTATTKSATSDEKKKKDDTNKDDDGSPYSVFSNWKRVLIIAFFILVLQWKRLSNLIDVAFNPPQPQQPLQPPAAPVK